MFAIWALDVRMSEQKKIRTKRIAYEVAFKEKKSFSSGKANGVSLFLCGSTASCVVAHYTTQKNYTKPFYISL